jgi:hypothetical protein
MAFAARARPDGYTVVIAPNSTYAVAPHLYQLAYNNDRDFVGVGLLVSMPIFMLVHRSSPATTVAGVLTLPTYCEVCAHQHLRSGLRLSWSVPGHPGRLLRPGRPAVAATCWWSTRWSFRGTRPAVTG